MVPTGEVIIQNNMAAQSAPTLKYIHFKGMQRTLGSTLISGVYYKQCLQTCPGNGLDDWNAESDCELKIFMLLLNYDCFRFKSNTSQTTMSYCITFSYKLE